MTHTEWMKLTLAQRKERQDLSGLSPQLTGLEGYRVEVVDTHGEKRRFIVSRSTGWVPCHIELNNRRSLGGMAADRHYQSVRPLYRVRER